MRCIRLFVAISFCIFFSNRAGAQSSIKGFTDDNIKFVAELTELFVEADKKPGRELMEQFTLVWNSGSLSEAQKKDIYKTCSLMLKKRLKPFPDFKNYLGSVMNFVNTKQAPASFAAWQQIIDKSINGKTIKGFVDFIAMSNNLFESNTFYKSASTEWGSNNNNYTFAYDSVPKVIFPSLNLKCYSKGDSAVIYNTKGVYYPTIQKFFGQGGRVNWVRAGIDENTSYAELKRYSIAVKSTEYTADSVTYYNKKYFEKPLLGVLQEKVLADMTGDKATYPRFESYTKKFELHIAENVDFYGGIKIVGARLQGSGTKEENAIMTFKRNGKVFLVASSKSYFIRPDKVTSDRSSVVIYHEDDSIYHPGLQFKFIVKDRELSLYRDEQGIAKSPYFNTYHGIDMYFEALSWKIDDPTIDLKMLIGSSQSFANFESSNYFREIRFAKLQGIDEVNPLTKIKNYAKSINSEVFYSDDLAAYMRLSPDQVRPMLLKLATGGFLIYDIDEEKVTIKERLYTYINAKGGQTDYDVIDFSSTITGKSNASINLLNFDMTIRGCPEIFLSDSQAVFVYPTDQEIILKKNRNFTFSGRVNAGRFEYFGKEFAFEYDQFKLNLTNIDSMRMKVRAKEKDDNGEYRLVRVRSIVENMKGEIQIDKFNNKSGVKPAPEYPVFKSMKESFVYYDRKNIQKGVYGRNKFYVQLEPFTFDSLDNFTNEALAFNGRVSSAGIFPDFNDRLTLQDDYSLGFIRSTPPEGFAMYGGKGKFENKIKLSNKGLRGDGVLNYVSSTSKSNDFIFFPDSMNAVVQSYVVAKSGPPVEFPPVEGQNVYTHWVPKKDVMSTSKIDKALVFYNGQSEMHGTVDLKPNGLSGKGRMDFAKSELESNLLTFKEKSFDSDTADFRLLAEGVDLSGLAFSTSNVKAHVDFEARTGDFKSNGGGSYVKFPLNQYICYMDKFKWFMDKGDIELTAEGKKSENPSDGDVDLTGSEFISVHPNQDSLRFFSPRAKYDTKKNIIYAKEVKYINVADARVYPDSGNVVVQKKAKMETLKNSKILANTVTKFHDIFDATIDVFARKSYAGSGSYYYIDETKQKQKIIFQNVSADTTGQTVAEGDIADTLNFSLGVQYEYRGKVKLTASNKFLTFTGATRIKHSCDNVNRNWFSFSSEINPEQIYIPVPAQPVDVENNKLFAGVILTNDSTHLYSTFLSKRENYSDVEVITADGFLYYDKPSKEYRISNMDKLKEISLPGNYYSLNTNNCTIYGEGKVNMGTTLGQINMSTVGNIKHNLNTDSVDLDLMLTLDFFFDEGVIKSMGEAIEKATTLTAVNFNRPTYEKGLRELVGKSEADKLISQVNLYGSFKKFPSELEHTMVFNDIKFKWNSNTKSYVSEGQIGIGNIYKNQVNKYVNGKIELVKKRSGDIINIYLAIDENNWYFFNYQTGLMQAISSDEKFNNTIKELKADKRKSEAKEKGQGAYQFIMSTGRKKVDFLKKFDVAEN